MGFKAGDAPGLDGFIKSGSVVMTGNGTKIINYTKEIKLVPAVVNVGVSYLNNPRQVTSILVKVGKRAMVEAKDARGRHLVRQNRCPYIEENNPSCGCDKDIHVDVTQPVVRFDKFNDSSLDFSKRLDEMLFIYNAFSSQVK